ncbi:AGE family epimerase/isomerase [Acetobacter sicerae]|uniref:AGE family epimerase/isomerase n=1 Tax=Acetobacter sicerae TaxID=85325 RepID=A0ABS8VS24_9PROT|nr:AGE family epimerase/isomerase [Acetobacter sicerae]MCE0743695.1 AGE family epimerase/isomerase [Acetobacter sicerae]
MAEMLPSLMVPTSSWLRRSVHRRWLDHQGLRLLDFSKPSRMKLGFGPLDEEGVLTPDASPDTILTARMTHSYAISAMRGVPGCLPLAEHGVAALREGLKDKLHGGWFTAPPETLKTARKKRKENYLHAFVALAASSAHVAGVAGASALLKDAAHIWETHFWSEEEGVFRESFAADWSDEENYRGANSNMHSVEACMALADVLDAPIWRIRALRSAERFIHHFARENGYAVPEHFDRSWKRLDDYNRDKPTDDLRPFGMTPGHFVEWSHLLLKLEAALLRQDGHAPFWLLTDAIGLFSTGMKAGWSRSGTGGLLYTVDFQLAPVVHNKPHWCQAEALTAAAALLKRTGHASYETWYRKIWDFIDLHMIDRKKGGWIQELDADNHPSEAVYPGKADLYHAWQATLNPLLPLSPSFATAISELDG